MYGCVLLPLGHAEVPADTLEVLECCLELGQVGFYALVYFACGAFFSLGLGAGECGLRSGQACVRPEVFHGGAYLRDELAQVDGLLM